MTDKTNTIIFDFDSTFVSCETLDVLASIIYQGSSELEKITAAIATATAATMAGDISIHASLIERINLLKIRKPHIAAVTDYIKQNISSSFIRNKDFIVKHSKDIFIFSGGFSEIIIPVIAEFHIPSSNVFANRFTFRGENVVGIDESCLMAHNNGKARQLEALKRPGLIHVIGDGFTDAEIKNANADVIFYLFTENVFRENLVEKADKIIGSLDEFIALQPP